MEFAGEIASEVNDPVYGNVFTKRGDRFNREQKGSSDTYSVSLSVPNSGSEQASDKGSQGKRGSYAKAEHPCVLCSQLHRLWHCENFKKLSPSESLNVVISHKLCHNCLLASHRTSDCGKRSVCGVPGCGKSTLSIFIVTIMLRTRHPSFRCLMLVYFLMEAHTCR